MTEALAAETTATEQPAAVVEDQNTEQAEQTTEPAPVTQDEETTKPPETEEQKRSKYQRRIDRKNADIAAARTEARLLRERLEQLEAQARPQAQRDNSAPKIEDFDNINDFFDARDAYVERKAHANFLKSETERKAIEFSKTIAESWHAKQSAAAEKYADFEDVIADADINFPPAMERAIIEADFGPDITYYLAQHPDEAKRIASLSPIRQIAEIGKLEDRVSKPAPKALTKAPEPITPAGSRAKAEKDPSQMTDAEFAKWRKAQIAQRR